MPPPQIRSSASSIAEPYGGYGAKFSPEIPMSSATNPTGQVFATAPLENLSQDPAIFPNNGASYQTFGLSPRQESYHSHGSANEYFNHDIIYNNEYNFHNETIFTNVNEEIPDDLFGPEVMRSMEDIHEQFGHGESFRSVEVKKRSTKRWWLSEKLRKFVRVVYTSKVFRKNRRNEHGIETEEISVQTTQVVGIAKKQDEPKEKSPGEPSRHMHDAKPQTGEGLALTMATSLNIIVQEPESIVEVGEVAKQQETTESAEQQKQLEDIKPVENASSTQESNTIDAGEPSKARSKVISDVKDAHATKSTELVVNDLVAGLIASTQELKIQDEPKNKSTEHIVEIEMSKAGVITV
ncbi:hypothetical protein M7I_8053 [Glarea lozoyensis 74030]|nr:hypothetical protein M7I_8053 [Glarea lozoyensis 74030]